MDRLRLVDPQPAGRAARIGLLLGLAAMGLSACASVGPSPADLSAGAASAGRHGTDKAYQVEGLWYYPHAQPQYDEVGSASWYGQQFHNHHTADGEIFDQYALSAAHKTLPLPCIVEVTNLDNGRRLNLRVNDRGPFVSDRILDVSRGAADALGFRGQGLARVRVRYLGPAPALAPVSYARQDVAPAERPEPTPMVPARPMALATAGPAPVAGDEPYDDTSPGSPGEAETPFAPPPSAPPPPPAAFAPTVKGFAVQAAAFADLGNARRAADQLAQAGAASIRPMTTRQGVTLYRVVLAGFADADAAETARAQVAAQGFGDARVIAAF